jgi:hypothetical protein
MRRLALFALLLLLAGCAGEEAHWMKPGNSAAQAAADYRTCHERARASVNEALRPEASRLDQMTAPPTLSGNSVNMVQDMQLATLAAQGRRRADAETATCMRSKGYIPQ